MLGIEGMKVWHHGASAGQNIVSAHAADTEVHQVGDLVVVIFFSDEQGKLIHDGPSNYTAHKENIVTVLINRIKDTNVRIEGSKNLLCQNLPDFGEAL